MAVGAGALAIYAGASRLLEPLRAETDQPGRVRVLLRAPIGKVLVQHAIVPLVVVVIGALLRDRRLRRGGRAARPRRRRRAARRRSPPPRSRSAPRSSSRRGGQLPPSLLAATYGDTSGMSVGLILGWIVVCPLLAVVLGTLPVSVVVHYGLGGLPQLVALLVAATVTLAIALGWERFAP